MALDTVFADRADRSDGFDLRALRYGAEEVGSRLYFAIRDRWWRTVPLVARRRHRAATPAGFTVEVDAVSAWESHPFEVSLRYAAAGPELVAEFTATARGAFAYCRIGFCLLLPADGFRGRPATSWRTGAPTALEFPTEIVARNHRDPAATRFHRPFDRLDTSLTSGTRLRYQFAGEEFELEDQRNWTDPSYKAYSCPPPEGWPVGAAGGERFAQRIRIQVEPGTGGAARAAGAAGSAELAEAAEADRAIRLGGVAEADRAIRLGGVVGVVPPIGLYGGRVSDRSLRPAAGFQELNARRPDPGQLAGYDSIELAVNGAVHAADDDSVQETTAVHGAVIAQTRAAYPDLPVRLAPVSFLDVPGDWLDEAGNYWPEPPAGALGTRLGTPFAATWAIASAARAVPCGPDLLRYFTAELPADAPAARAVARLAALRGRPVLAVTAPPPVAALAVVADGAVTLALANPAPDPTSVRLPDGREVALDGFGSAWFELAHRLVDAGVAADPRAATEGRPG